MELKIYTYVKSGFKKFKISNIKYNRVIMDISCILIPSMGHLER